MVKIHLVDTSNDRGQYGVLLDERYPSTLLSYAYKNLLPAYSQYWESLIELGVKPNIIFDSGAFTAFNSGKTINIRDYFNWTQEISKLWGDRANIEFIALDTIGDPTQTKINHRQLENWGLRAIPVFGYGEDIPDLLQLLEQHDRIALGGLVPYVTKRKLLSTWLDRCYRAIINPDRPLPKIHLLGITSEWVLNRYPCYSCDSSGWTEVFRFGKTKNSGLPFIPRSSKSNQKTLANAIRSEVRRINTLQDDITKIWQQRGINFDE